MTNQLTISINQANFAPLTKAGLANRYTSGFYKKTTRGVQLLDGKGDIFAFITNNDSGFIVSARRHEDNKIRYSFGLCSLEARRFGYDETLGEGLNPEDKKHFDQEVQKVLNQLGFRN